MFHDASAIVAVLAEEAEAAEFIAAIEGAPSRSSSAVALFEAALGLARIRRLEPAEALSIVESFCAIADVEIVPLGADEARAAVDAHARFGKGRGHPARLNMGDCFALAAAVTRGLPLLFKGDDFSETDVIVALQAGRER